MTKVIDLTKTLNSSLVNYSSGSYYDPKFSADTWCTVEAQGYWVSKIIIGTQTGTHIDAPAHFKEGADTLDKLPVEKLMGPYFLVSLDDAKDIPPADLVKGYQGQQILFLHSSTGSSLITPEQLAALIELNIPVWAGVGSIVIVGEEPLSFHKHIAESGIYLIEGLNLDACQEVPADGELIALPLKLEGLSGSPCRVLVRS